MKPERRSESNGGVYFSLNKNYILTGNPERKLIVSLNQHGQCRFKVNGEGEFLRWQVAMKGPYIPKCSETECRGGFSDTGADCSRTGRMQNKTFKISALELAKARSLCYYNAHEETEQPHDKRTWTGGPQGNHDH